MARPKKETTWDDSTVHAFMDAQASAKSVHGDVQNSAISAAVDIGIRLPSLAARYLFQRTSLPFERTLVVFGPPGSSKSALMYWFYDLYIRAGGYYLHVDAEDKDTPILRLSLTDYKENAGWPVKCETINDYQQTVDHYLDWYVGACAKVDGPGKRVPFIIGIDSLVAKLTAEASKKISDNSGAPERRFADEARSLADWFKYIPSKLQGYPLCLAAVNHDKPKADQNGQPMHHSPGGTAPNFFATYKILTARVRTIKQNQNGWEGNRIKLSMEKNSLAADRRSIEVELMWRVGPGPSRSGGTTTVQETKWNWAKATTEILYYLCQSENRKNTGRRGARTAEILGIQKASGGRYYSKALDVPSSDPLLPEAFGLYVETRRDLLDLLEPELGIHRSIEYRPHVDYDEQRTEAALRVDDLMPAARTTVADETDGGTDEE
jgi:hypothetical protein